MGHAYRISDFEDQEQKVAVAAWLGRRKLTFDFNSSSLAGGDNITVFSMNQDTVCSLRQEYPAVTIDREFNINVKILF